MSNVPGNSYNTQTSDKRVTSLKARYHALHNLENRAIMTESIIMMASTSKEGLLYISHFHLQAT